MGLKKYKLHLSPFFLLFPFFLFFNIEFYLNLIKIFFDIVNNNLLFHGFHFIKLIKNFLVICLILSMILLKVKRLIMKSFIFVLISSNYPNFLCVVKIIIKIYK